MRRFSYSLLLSLMLFAVMAGQAQSGATGDSTEVPGDNFSLQAALDFFKKAGSPEEFEKLINSEGNEVNNLDLNGDGEIDYVRVIDKQQGDLHAFVLQVPVSETESQDIAVIELEKTGETTAMLQIVGDEDVYGEQVIVEPVDEEKDAALLEGDDWMASGPSTSITNWNESGVFVNVWFWPSVRFVYAPAYRPWISPFTWRSRPVWWRPWKPVRYKVFYPRRLGYQRHYAVVPTMRVARVHRFYAPVRVTSVTVRTRHSVAITRYRVAGTHRRAVVVPAGPRKVKVAKRIARRKRR